MKQITTPEKRRTTGFRSGTSSLQYPRLWPANYCLQKVYMLTI